MRTFWSILSIFPSLSAMLAHSTPSTGTARRYPPVACADSGARNAVTYDIPAILAELRASNPKLVTLRAQLRAVEARQRATGFTSPLTLSGEAEEVPRAAVHRAGSLRIGLGATLLTGAQRRAEQAIANATVMRTRAMLEAAELSLMAQVTQLVETAVIRTIEKDRLDAESLLLREINRSLTSRFSVGDARYVDVLRLRTEQLRVTTALARTARDIRVARTTLAGLAGDDVRIAAAVTRALDHLIAQHGAQEDSAQRILPPLPELEHALANALSIQLADFTTLVARANAERGAAVRRPQLTASTGMQRFGDAVQGPSNWRYGLTLGASLTLPFTARTANQRAAAADAEQIRFGETALAATRAQLRSALMVAQERHAAAVETLSHYDFTLLRGAREERESALASYRAGTMTLLELLDFERELVHAETERLNTRLDVVHAYADFIAIMTGEHDSTAILGTSDDTTNDLD